jgi:hypothetical protein
MNSMQGELFRTFFGGGEVPVPSDTVRELAFGCEALSGWLREPLRIAKGMGRPPDSDFPTPIKDSR